jgi:hypothetical protein
MSIQYLFVKCELFKAEKEKKLRAMGRALTDLKQEMMSAAQEGGSAIGHNKADDDAEERSRKDKEIIQVRSVQVTCTQVSIVIVLIIN